MIFFQIVRLLQQLACGLIRPCQTHVLLYKSCKTPRSTINLMRMGDVGGRVSREESKFHKLFIKCFIEKTVGSSPASLILNSILKS